MAIGISQTNKQAFRNPWVIGWLALLLLVLGVNIYMISMAIVSSPGLVSSDFYERGRSLERSVQSRQAAKSALGWNLTLDTGGELKAAKAAPFQMNAADKSGSALTGAHVVVYAYRPSDAESDFSVPLAEKAPGQYAGDVAFPLKGAWDLIVEVKHGESTYQVPRRVSVFGN